jgi:hypothetical protein
MACPTCGFELDSAGNCAHCSTPAVSAAPNYPLSYSVGPFLPIETEVSGNRWKVPLFTWLSVILFVFVVWLNYLRAMRWAGVINDESLGYMFGGIIFNPLLGLLGMYAVQRMRRKKMQAASKALGVAAIALFLSVIGLAGETANRREIITDAYHKAGNLLKEAAGKQPRSADVNWWDEPTRDFFGDVLQMNQRYAAEVAALDRSAIKDLYSSKSYGGDVHMQKVVMQLRAVQAVDEKYASLDPLFKRMEDHVATANASENEKQEFLKGMRGSMDEKLGPRKDLLRKEEEWTKSTIDLYDFAIAHLADYSIQDNKLYFRNDAMRQEFFSQQARAVALHKDFLKAKKAMEEVRKSNMNQMGVSPSDLTPTQLGKTK